VVKRCGGAREDVAVRECANSVRQTKIFFGYPFLQTHVCALLAPFIIIIIIIIASIIRQAQP
jgi:hypothetical protein